MPPDEIQLIPEPPSTYNIYITTISETTFYIPDGTTSSHPLASPRESMAQHGFHTSTQNKWEATPSTRNGSTQCQNQKIAHDPCLSLKRIERKRKSINPIPTHRLPPRLEPLADYPGNLLNDHQIILYPQDDKPIETSSLCQHIPKTISKYRLVNVQSHSPEPLPNRFSSTNHNQHAPNTEQNIDHTEPCFISIITQPT